MNTKSLLLLALLISGSVLQTFSQENKVVSAWAHLDEYNKYKDTVELKAAKDAIDVAALNDKTINEPKMWLYRGQVYFALFDHQLNTIVNNIMKKEGKPTDAGTLQKMNSEAYISVDTNNICVAAYSFVRVTQLETKGERVDEARSMLPVCLNRLANKAISAYNARIFPVALAMFEKEIWLTKEIGVSDTSELMRQNIQNAGRTAQQMQNYQKALVYYQQLADIYKKMPPSDIGAQPYLAMVDIYMTNMKDTAKGLEILKQGMDSYPGNVMLLIKQINFYLHAHNSAKAIGNLQTAISKLELTNNPQDKPLLAKLYFALGNTYDNMANPKNDSGRALPKPSDYDSLFSKAESGYTKAAQLAPDNFDILFDLGALYNNRAGEINKEANNLPVDQTDKFNKLQAEANGYFKKAQPWLEQALPLAKNGYANAKTPDVQAIWKDNLTSTIRALKAIYVGTGQTDKIKGLNN